MMNYFTKKTSNKENYPKCKYSNNLRVLLYLMLSILSWSLTEGYLVVFAYTPSALTNTETVPNAYYERLATAIYHAEGGKKTRHPYGILSVSCHGEKECRKICLNTLHNNFRRYQRDNDSNGPLNAKEGHWIEFLADRYCPPSVDPVGNLRWIRNVTYFMSKEGL